LSIASIINFGIANGKDPKYYFESPFLWNNYKGDLFYAFKLLVPTVIGYIIPIILSLYCIFYMLVFKNIIERNFKLVPRNLVLSNMIYVQNTNIGNKHLEISANIAAAMRRNELNYD
jgi:hypothetical protein